MTAEKKKAPNNRKRARSPASKSRAGAQSGAPAQGQLLPDTAQDVAGDILDSRLLLPQKVMAIGFGISVQSFQKWRIKPRMTRGREALYYLPDCIEYQQTRGAEGKLNLSDERARLAKAQADRVELEVQQLKGELIPAGVILENWEPIVGAARAKILAIPTKCKSAIPKLTDRNVARIKAICRAALEDLANSGIPKSAKPDNRKGL